PLRGPDREAGEVDFAGAIAGRRLGGLAADESRAGCAAAPGDPSDDLDARGRVKLADREIVEEEKRLGPSRAEVIDGGRAGVEADRMEDAGDGGYRELGADAAGRCEQNRIGIAGSGQVEGPGEVADLGLGADPPRRAHDRTQTFDE